MYLTFAVAVVDPKKAPLNVVEPQPDVDTIGVPDNVYDGKTTSIVSEVFSGTFNEKENSTEEVDSVTG